MLIAEDLLLLLTEDNSGRLAAPAAHVDIGLAGANLLELAMMNKVDLTRHGDEGSPGRLIVRDPSPTGDDVLDAALAITRAQRLDHRQHGLSKRQLKARAEEIAKGNWESEAVGKAIDEMVAAVMAATTAAVAAGSSSGG